MLNFADYVGTANGSAPQNEMVPKPWPKACHPAPPAASLYWHWPSLVQRGIPVVFYPAAVCAAVSLQSQDAPLPTSARPALWLVNRTDCRPRSSQSCNRAAAAEVVVQFPHPPLETHRFVGQLVAASLLELKQVACAGDVARESGSAASAWERWLSTIGEFKPPASARCTAAPTVHMSVAQGRKSDDLQPSLVGSRWHYGEDVKGKPGWLFHPPALGACSGCDIAFEFGMPNKTEGSGRSHATLDVVALRSWYSDMGVLTCAVHELTGGGRLPLTVGHMAGTAVMNGKWEDHASQAAVATFPLDLSGGARLRLTCSGRGGKVKLLAFRVCNNES